MIFPNRKGLCFTWMWIFLSSLSSKELVLWCLHGMKSSKLILVYYGVVRGRGMENYFAVFRRGTRSILERSRVIIRKMLMTWTKQRGPDTRQPDIPATPS